MSVQFPTLRGTVWLLGDNISTDVLSPGPYVHAPNQERLRHVLEAVRPDFAPKVQSGDLVVAGRNFGCGSSRESAPQHLKDLGVAAVVAESFSRIFARNAIAIGLPVLTCAGVRQRVRDQEEIAVDVVLGAVVLSDGTALAAERIPPEMLTVLSSGGIVPMLRAIAQAHTHGGGTSEGRDEDGLGR